MSHQTHSHGHAHSFPCSVTEREMCGMAGECAGSTCPPPCGRLGGNLPDDWPERIAVEAHHAGLDVETYVALCVMKQALRDKRDRERATCK